MKSNLLKLQNGSDIRGIAIETPELQANLTPDTMHYIANGIINWLRQNYQQEFLANKLVIGIGRDSRLSGETLANAFIKSATKQGVNVLDFGIATTPAMFMSTQFSEFNCHAAIMITASHLPYYFNGIKIFNRTSGAEHEDITYILTHTDETMSNSLGTVTTADIITPYAADMVQKIKDGMKTTSAKPLQGLNIIVDAGNGAGGFFADKVLKPLGADTTGSQFLEPDGTFPNHIPNPDNKEAIQSIKDAVLRQQADLGVIFDTDVDRSAVITKSGNVLNRNNLIAVLSKIILADYPNSAIVTNSPTSSHLKAFIEDLGGKQIRYICGYRNVINKAIALNEEGINCPLAIETSGHAAFKENYFLDDGAYVIAKLLMLLPELISNHQSFDTLIDDLKQPVETQEVRLKIAGENYKEIGLKALADLAKVEINGLSIDLDNHEGVRFNLTAPFGNGWFLVRMSLHEPLLVIQIENDQAGYMNAILTVLLNWFNNYPEINTSTITHYLANH